MQGDRQGGRVAGAGHDDVTEQAALPVKDHFDKGQGKSCWERIQKPLNLPKEAFKGSYEEFLIKARSNDACTHA